MIFKDNDVKGEEEDNIKNNNIEEEEGKLGGKWIINMCNIKNSCGFILLLRLYQMTNYVVIYFSGYVTFFVWYTGMR